MMFLKKRKNIKRLTYHGFMLTLSLVAFSILGCGGGGGDSAADLKKMSVAFGDVVLDHVKDQTVLLNNNGASTLSIGQIALADPLSAQFSFVSDDCSGKSLASSETCTLQFRFEPTVQGAFSDTFYIPSDDPNRDIGMVNVSGEGIALNVSINQAEKDCANSKITLYVTVTDRNDDPLTLIPQNDFSLLEDNASMNITRFSNSAFAALSVVLALDYSVSTETVRPEIEEAATFFIENLQLDSGTDEAAIIKFGASIEPAQASFTDDEALLKSAINDTPSFSGLPQTLLYDAIWQSTDNIDSYARNDRRAIIVLSDGLDTRSVKKLNEVIDHALEKGVPVFTIGLGDVNVPVMLRLADETGGQFFRVDEFADLLGIYGKIANILSNQYEIEYTSFPSGGAPIAIDVQVDFDFQGEILHGEGVKEIPGC